MNGADQAFTTNAAGMHRRGLFAGGTAAALAGAVAVLMGRTASAAASAASGDAITGDQAVAILSAAPSQCRDEKLFRFGLIANGTKAPVRRRALYALADEALRLAALEPQDTGEVESPHPDAQLLQFASAFLDEDAVVTAWNAGEVAEGIGEAALDRWWDCVERLTEIPAVSIQGLRAKARCVLRAVEVTDETPGAADDCARSVLAEFAGWRADA